MEPEQREFEHLWKHVVSVGTEWKKLHLVNDYSWSFSNLQEAFEEGGVLHGKNVYIFSQIEPTYLHLQRPSKFTYVPVLIAVTLPFPPSDKIGICSIDGRCEKIFDMKQMKMDWVPYIPSGKRYSSVERPKSQIFILTCVETRSALEHLNRDQVRKFEICNPYFYNPLKLDYRIKNTTVEIKYPMEPKPIIRKLDWELDDIEDLANKLIIAKELSEDWKDSFMVFVERKVREAKIAFREAMKENQKKAKAKLSKEEIAAYENMKVYKFYPVATPDTPDVFCAKASHINMYYGHAHRVL